MGRPFYIPLLLANTVAATPFPANYLTDKLRVGSIGCLRAHREDNADKSFRQRYPDYSQTPSSRLSADLQSTTQQMLTAHETARQHDATVSHNLQDSAFLEQMRLLGLSQAELKDMLPAPSTSSGMALYR